MIRAGLSTDLRTLFTLLAIFPAMDASYSLFNALVPWFVQPTRLIGFEYKEGLPEEARTLVAVPTFITSRDSIDEQIRNLEVHYLTNPRGEIYFALVSDWTDAKQEITLRTWKSMNMPARKSPSSMSTIPATTSHAFPHASPPPLQREAELLDGLGAQARQAA